MFSKPRKPNALLMFEALSKRTRLSQSDQRIFYQLRMGYEGELNFFQLLSKSIQKEFRLFYDINLFHNGKEAQFDVILFSASCIYHFDIKNYRNDYYIEGDRWFRKDFGEVENPIYQLKRADMVLKKFVGDKGFQLPVVSKLVFINDSFHLYGAEVDGLYIFKSQLHQYFEKLYKKYKAPQALIIEKFMREIKKAHQTKSKFSYEPDCSLYEMEKGMKCSDCSNALFYTSRYTLICQSCQKKEYSTVSLQRHISEFSLLFPELDLNWQNLSSWCGQQVGRSTLYRALKRYKGR